MKKFIQEFRDFAVKGNAFDLAIGVIIGAAFSAIVNSLVKDILMPLLSIVFGQINITDLKLVIRGIPGSSKIVISYGSFLQAVINFLIIAFCIFLMVKAITRLHQKKVEAPKPDPSLVVLTEIRDLLQEKANCETEN
ncbi:large-conductance mechanosensitive channel protein MscL [Ethanoligenens sp.]|uniref:large-conductance mechanosensitive channel protein MscL n=1 Tax=Ethanoligenens sp. TaxID=2099655 RepID=UPI0039EBA98E